jgi:hypothetical protein
MHFAMKIWRFDKNISQFGQFVAFLLAGRLPKKGATD